MDGGSNNNKIEEMKLNSKENDHKFALIAVIARAAAATATWHGGTGDNHKSASIS